MQSKFFEIQARMAACGDNAACAEKAMQEMEAISKQYMIDSAKAVTRKEDHAKVEANIFMGEPCAYYDTLPETYPLTICYPIYIDVVWDIVENHTPFPDDPEPVNLKWLISSHMEGELIVTNKPDCRKPETSCIASFTLAAPGSNEAGRKKFSAKIRNAYIKIVDHDSYGKPKNFTADTSKFLLDSDVNSVMSSSNLGALGFDINPSEKQSEGYIGAPEFGWMKNTTRESWVNYGSLSICWNDIDCTKDSVDTVVMDSYFLPGFDDVIKLLKGRNFEKSVSIDYISKDSWGNTEKRIIKGNLRYRISLHNKKPGKLKVSPNNSFEATRNSEKEKYKPRSKTYTLTNTGKSPISFEVSENVKWLKIQNTTGKLEPKQNSKVIISLTPAADKLKNDEQRTLIKFKNTTNHKGDTSRRTVLKNIEKWRLSIYGKEDLFVGSGFLYGGIHVKYRTDLNFEIKKVKNKKKYQNGKANTYFASIKGLSYPAGVFDCIVEKSDINRKSYPVPGNIFRDLLKLTFPSPHNYRISFNCLTDTDRLRDCYNQKWEKIIKKHQKSKNPGKNLLGKWRKDVKDWVESDIRGVRKSFTVRDIRPVECWDSKSGGTITIPLKNGWEKEWGRPDSINYLLMKLKRVE